MLADRRSLSSFGLLAEQAPNHDRFMALPLHWIGNPSALERLHSRASQARIRRRMSVILARSLGTLVVTAVAHDRTDAGMHPQLLGDLAPAHPASIRAVTVAHRAKIGDPVRIRLRPGDDADRATDSVRRRELGQHVVRDLEAVRGESLAGMSDLVGGRRTLVLVSVGRLLARLAGVSKARVTTTAALAMRMTASATATPRLFVRVIRPRIVPRAPCREPCHTGFRGAQLHRPRSRGCSGGMTYER